MSDFFRTTPLNWVGKLILFFTILFSFGLFCSYLAPHISPMSFWPFAFAGLAYPIFLLGTILSLMWWLFRKRKWLFLPLTTIVLGFNHHSHFFQLSSAGSPLENGNSTFQLLSYNVRLFDLYNWEHNKETRDSIFRFLKSEDPEIICFQEFYHRDQRGIFTTRDTLVKFLKAKNFHEGYTHKLHEKQFFGLAILSSYPILDKGEIKFENDDNNNVIWADIKIDQEIVRVYNAHLASIRFQRGDYEFIGDTANSNKWLYPHQKRTPEEQKIIERLRNAFIKRSQQVDVLMKHISEYSGKVILAGDFNDTPVSYCYGQITDQLEDAFIESGNGIGNTYIGKFPSFRIDYLFHSPNVHSFNYITHNIRLSDHFPISARFQVE